MVVVLGLRLLVAFVVRCSLVLVLFYKGLIADTRLWLEVSCLRFGLGAEVLPLTCRICCGALNCGGALPFGFCARVG